MKKFNPITRKYEEVTKDTHYYVNEKGERLYRIETKGRSGKVQYRNGSYLQANGTESSVYGMGGSTGHGWGGQIIGYATEADLENTNIR